MATPAHRLIQDQNLNILYDGKADKKTRLAGRKALNDISNSRKPSSLLHPVKKDGSKNVISIEKDPVGVKSKIISKTTTDKGKVGGRKALTDVTNSVKPPSKHDLSSIKKLTDVSCVADERFMHNHQECVEARAKSVDMGYFLKSVGLNNDIPVQAKKAPPLSLKKRTSKHWEMQEMWLEDQIFECSSPVCRSPQSPKVPYVSWADNDFSELMVIETPKLV